MDSTSTTFRPGTLFLTAHQIARANQASFDTAMQCVELFMDFSRFCHETFRTTSWLQLFRIPHTSSEAISCVTGLSNDQGECKVTAKTDRASLFDTAIE